MGKDLSMTYNKPSAAGFRLETSADVLDIQDTYCQKDIQGRSSTPNLKLLPECRSEMWATPWTHGYKIIFKEINNHPHFKLRQKWTAIFEL